MGMISSLVASPCLTAPLAGALVYLSSTGNQFIGGSALFSLGIGFGIPMLILGASGGKLILKAGNWMKHIKTAWLNFNRNGYLDAEQGSFRHNHAINLGSLFSYHTYCSRYTRAC
ncbi:hypothetical protein GW535_00235 [Piscirickettsia salmonis]|nr:hypothetical protein GW535_00235 [Piscirickettsia salmonis]